MNARNYYIDEVIVTLTGKERNMLMARFWAGKTMDEMRMALAKTLRKLAPPCAP
jgi:hypothetical protein